MGLGANSPFRRHHLDSDVDIPPDRSGVRADFLVGDPREFFDLHAVTARRRDLETNAQPKKSIGLTADADMRSDGRGLKWRFALTRDAHDRILEASRVSGREKLLQCSQQSFRQDFDRGLPDWVAARR